MREIGNRREHQKEILANDREAAIDYVREYSYCGDRVEHRDAETCANGCSNGSCVSGCTSHSDCGSFSSVDSSGKYCNSGTCTSSSSILSFRVSD